MFLPTNLTLKFGDSGDFVAELQRRLSIVKCFNESAINGFYDGTTVNGVSQFQSMSGLRADGIAGPKTLRRLNGSLSGDNTSGAEHKSTEEEIRRQQEAAALALNRQMLLAEQQAQLQAQQAQQQPEPTMVPVQQQPAQQQPAALQPQTVDVAAPTAAQQQLQQQIMREQMMMQQQTQQSPAAPQPTAPQPTVAPQQQAPVQQPAAPSASDMIAQLLVQQKQGAAVAQPAERPPLAAPQPVGQQPQTAQPAAASAGDMLAQMLSQQQAGAPQQQSQALAKIDVQQVAVPAEQPKGLVGRAMQFASDTMQKLSNYFESKLPAPVLNEVKEIGHTMARAGMQEAPIPTGPEQQRSAEQGRGQQQGRQIG